jgi:hypothetical protein
MEFVKRFKIRLQGGRDGHCAPRKVESSSGLVKFISQFIKQMVSDVRELRGIREQ